MAERPLGTIWFDRDGDFLRYKTANGLDVRYKPYGCNRILGTCTYTENRNGKKRRLVSTVAVKGTSACYTARDRDTGELARKGGFELGPNGLNTTGWHLVIN